MNLLNRVASEETLDLDYFREKLVVERERLRRLLGAVTGSLQIREESDSDDDASEKLRVRLQNVNKALLQVEKGTYGLCISCGKRRIPSTCLEKEPCTIHCFLCALDSHTA